MKNTLAVALCAIAAIFSGVLMAPRDRIPIPMSTVNLGNARMLTYSGVGLENLFEGLPVVRSVLNSSPQAPRRCGSPSLIGSAATWLTERFSLPKVAAFS